MWSIAFRWVSLFAWEDLCKLHDLDRAEKCMVSINTLRICDVQTELQLRSGGMPLPTPLTVKAS